MADGHRNSPSETFDEARAASPRRLAERTIEGFPATDLVDL